MRSLLNLIREVLILVPSLFLERHSPGIAFDTQDAPK